MTHAVLEQLASQRQAELATRVAQHHSSRRPRGSTSTAGSPRARSGAIAARLVGLVGRS